MAASSLSLIVPDPTYSVAMFDVDSLDSCLVCVVVLFELLIVLRCNDRNFVENWKVDFSANSMKFDGELSCQMIMR